PFHWAMEFASTSPTSVKYPPMYTFPEASTTAARSSLSAPGMLGFMLVQLASVKAEAASVSRGKNNALARAAVRKSLAGKGNERDRKFGFVFRVVRMMVADTRGKVKAQ